MLKSLCVATPSRTIRIAWLSLQPDGSISFGLQDKTYIAPAFKAQHFVWNAYNRVKLQYILPSEHDALEPVRNPHFTFHPSVWFQLTSGPQGPQKARLFEAIADVGISVQQNGHLPWLRATTGSLRYLRTGSLRKNHQQSEDLPLLVPSEMCSIAVDIDFIQPGSGSAQVAPSIWTFDWHDVSIRLRMSMTLPQIPTLSWFHFH